MTQQSWNKRSSRIACFLDFDHTLFNTDEFFHLDLRIHFLQLGIDLNCWEESYTAIWSQGYSIDRHIEEINRRSPIKIPPAAGQSLLADHVSDLGRYLFADVMPALQQMKQAGISLYLLSFGHPEWQQFKVSGSGVSQYVEDMFFTLWEGRKADLLQEKSRSFDQVVVIDNNPAELDLIKDTVPEARTYCINRVPDEHVTPADEAARLRYLEARKYLEKARRHQHHDCKTLEDLPI